jgi:hypothetical protein
MKPYHPTDTVIGRVLGALLRREILTGKDCWLRFGSSRLGHHIYALRGDGWDIEAERINVKTSDNGRVARIARYSLTSEAISKAGEFGKMFADACKRIEQAHGH